MHSTRRKTLTTFALAVALGGAALAGLSKGRSAHADPADVAERNARCATRLSIALVGDAPKAAALASQNPQGDVDAMIATSAFTDRWASFVNSEFNGGPSADPLQDPVYFSARWVLQNDKPWKELFVGAFDLAPSVDKKSLDVTASTTGLGYFRTKAWMTRYAGNEDAGIRLSAAYRMIQNTTGLSVPASVAQPGQDRTATGRRAPECANCHFNPWFALDTAAGVLSRVVKDKNGVITGYDSSKIASAPLLGKTIASDADLLHALVDSDAFDFNQCRLVFKFLYGRSENQCEAPVFDACVDTLRSTGSMKKAIAVVAKDPSFCQ